MTVRLFDSRGTPLDRQSFTWKELAGHPISKLDDDAFTRVRIILMNGIEQQVNRFAHVASQMNGELREPLARLRRAEHHQQTLVNWLIGPDHSPLETTIAYEQVAIEVTAAVAQQEPDPYLAQVYRFGLLEDFDHMYRYSALMDRVEGKDANNILQSYTDIVPGRPTSEEHRDPADDLREHYDRATAHPITKMNALTIMSGEYQTRDYYMNIGPTFTDPIARELYAEIASIEEQHVTQYGSIIDPYETLLEKLLLYQANEAYNYYSCVESETNSRIKAIWERFLEYELGHVAFVAELFKRYERRDPAEVLPETLPDAIAYQSQRDFVRQTLEREVDLRTDGARFVDASQESTASLRYREQLNAAGSPSDTVAAGYMWHPGTELTQRRTRAA
jgi:rubrerythrin